MNSPKVKRVLRSPREIRKMRTAGLVVWQAHQAAARILAPGVTTEQLNQAYRATFAKYNAVPLFLNYGGPPAFPAETCISINEQVVHGIPGSYVVKDGDVVSLDTGCKINGWCGDAAVTHAVGNISEADQRLLAATNGVLNLAIEMMKPDTLWSTIAKAMEAYILERGFSVVEEMVGHGIGQELHEPPQVPNYCSPEFVKKEDFDIRPGLVIAVEPMINAGAGEIECLDDDWTIVTADGKTSAHFEHTIAITKDGPIRLTGPPSDDELETLPEWIHDKTKWVLW